MGKLVIRNQGRVVNEIDLKLGDTTIGRDPHCDVVIDDPAVSTRHALIKTVGMKATLQDLGSTNGTFIENNRIKQHELKNGETIIIGAHSLVYRDAINLHAPVFGKKSAVPAPPSAQQRQTTLLLPFAQLIVIEGKDKDKPLSLIKDVVTLDNPGKGPARITRTTNGYLLEASIGAGEPTLNRKPIPPGGQILESGDIIEIAGGKLRFFY